MSDPYPLPEAAGPGEPPRPPDAPAVARRALGLGALILRGQFEHTVQTSDDSDLLETMDQELFSPVLTWLEREGILWYLSRRETDLVGRPVGSWAPEEILAVRWCAESLGVLLWALGRITVLPPYDTAFWQQDVLRPLRILSPTADFLEMASLIASDEIAQARRAAALWHWRSQMTPLERTGATFPSGPSGRSRGLREVIRDTLDRAFPGGGLPRPLRDDLPAFGKPYRDLTDEEYETATAIAIERHFALNWLSGYSEDWDETPVDV